jgi:hypothetical protein
MMLSSNHRDSESVAYSHHPVTLRVPPLLEKEGKQPVLPSSHEVG